MKTYRTHRPVIVKTRIDTENIDVDHLLHIYNFHSLPQEIQEAMISFIPVFSQIPSKTKKSQPILLCLEDTKSGEERHYIAPSMLTEFCSEFTFSNYSANYGKSFLITMSPNTKSLLENINFSIHKPPYMGNDVIAIKLANGIAFKHVKVDFTNDAVIFVCDIDKNFRVEDFIKALGLEMKHEVSRQGDVDVFRLTGNHSEGVTLEAIQNAVFRNYGNLLLKPRDVEVLNVLDAYYSRGKQ